MSWWLWVPVAWLLLGVVMAPFLVGKQFRVFTRGAAIWRALLFLAMATCVLKGGGVL